MRTALTALISAASLCAIATAASAQSAPVYADGGWAGWGPTIPSHTGAPLYSYHRTAAVPAVVGSCQILAGNRVCSDTPADGAAAYGPVGAVIAAPIMVAAAPFEMIGVIPAPNYGYTYAPATGAPAYAYGSQVGPQPGAVGSCSIISGNRVCFGVP